LEHQRPRHLKAKIGRLLLAGFIVFGGVGYVFRHSLFPKDYAADHKPEASAPTPMAVSVLVVEPRRVTREVVAGGTLVAREDVLVTAQVSGVSILQVMADVGDQVSEGQALAVLDGQRIDLQFAQKAADLARAEASVAQATALFSEATASAKEAQTVADRAIRLRAKAAISEQALQEKVTLAATAKSRADAQEQALTVAKAELLRVMAERDELEWQRGQLTVRAPVSGVISERNAKVGQTTGADGTPLLRIIKGGEVEMEATVLETALAGIRAGQEVWVTLPGPDRPLEGIVRLVSPSVDPEKRTGKVWVRLSATDLRPGTFASARFLGDERDAIIVPHAAVLTSDLGTHVQVVEAGVLRLRSVETGLITPAGIEIIAGLLPGDVVVASAGIFLREGSMVTPVTANAAGGF
jgi:HlyD family secretion protein